MKRRTHFEYALRRRISRKADFLRYIEYEMNLEALRRRRRERLGTFRALAALRLAQAGLRNEMRHNVRGRRARS